MVETGIGDFTLTLAIVAGIFFMFYTAYRQQGLIDTVNEIREIFQDKVEDVADMGVYK